MKRRVCLLALACLPMVPAVCPGDGAPAVVPETPSNPTATVTNPPVAVASSVAPAARPEVRKTVPSSSLLGDDESLYDLLIAKRLSVGASFSSVSMKKTHVPYDPGKNANFLGNINRLEESDRNGFGVVVRYEICPYVGFQFSNDLHAELGMWNKENESRDANFVLDGYTYEVLLMVPIDAIRLTPYIGLGYTDLSCSIEYNNWWHYGWSSPADYDAYGNGSTVPRNEVTRWIEVEEPSSAFTFSAGVSLKLFRYAQLDLFYRTVRADDASIEFRRGIRTATGHMLDGYVPLECSTFGGALRVVF